MGLSVGDITGFGSVADLGKDIIDKIFPDKTQAEQAKAALALAQAQGALQEVQDEWDNAKQQTIVNAQEAASSNAFVAGWRPFIGWICGLALLWQYVLLPIVAFTLAAIGHAVALPVLDTSGLMTLLLSMLGLGAMRSFDKLKGTSPDAHA